MREKQLEIDERIVADGGSSLRRLRLDRIPLGEPGASVVTSILTDPSQTCCAHSINLCEVYYQVIRRSDEATAQKAIADLRALGLIERSNIDEPSGKRLRASRLEAGSRSPIVFVSASRSNWEAR